MKRLVLWTWCIASIVVTTGCTATYEQHPVRTPSPSPGGQVSVSNFYDSLAPYGQWFQDPPYGWCWTPYDVSADWRPYSDGYWEYTDYGWSWVSNEPWGWAPYHYGRWFFDDSYGWVWVPGTEWAPAWVAWRDGDDCVGWAPLPPTAGWDASAGLSFADASVIPTHEWCFVPRAHVLDVNLRVQVTSVARNVTLMGRSHDATRFEVRGGRPANLGLDLAVVERSVGHTVPMARIQDVDSPTRGGGRPMGNGSIGFYRPAIRAGSPDQAPAPAITARGPALQDDALQRQREDQQRKLESELTAERARLARDQANELQARPPGAAVDDLRKRHEVEQQAFEAHAAQQRQVLNQRMRKQIMRLGKNKTAGKPGDHGQDQGKDKGGH